MSTFYCLTFNHPNGIFNINPIDEKMLPRKCSHAQLSTLINGSKCLRPHGLFFWLDMAYLPSELFLSKKTIYLLWLMMKCSFERAHYINASGGNDWRTDTTRAIIKLQPKCWLRHESGRITPKMNIWLFWDNRDNFKHDWSSNKA